LPWRRAEERHYMWLESYMEWLEGKEERTQYHALLEEELASLSLRFKREKFWYGLYSVPKLLAVAVYADSGALFERRVALGSAREAALGPSG
jgi:hypothetical protein